MPPAPIPGFLKKRSATRQYNRSARQIARDIAIAIDMRDESVLDHVVIRTEEGNVIDGTDVTSDLIKRLRNDGLNPTWYFRKTWLKETYGLRTNPVAQSDERAEEDTIEHSPEAATHSDQGMIALMQESIRELKKDKELLTEQLRIKDNQLQESTSRWKETNYISQNLNKRLEAMEQQLKLVGSTAALLQAGDDDRSFESATPDETPTPLTEATQKPAASKSAKKPARSSITARKRRRTSKSATRPNKNAARRKSAPRKSPAKSATSDHKWYDMPTLRRLLSRNNK